MARTPISRGTCLYCGAEFTKNAIGKHLQTCTARQKRKEEASTSQRQAEILQHIRVEDAYNKNFWLHLEVRGSASLKQIDSYLRDIWLECCDHLSKFSAVGQTIGMTRKVNSIFQPGTTLLHIYDFGTSSKTLLTSLDAYEGVPLSKHPLSLMARNLMPQEKCMECDEPATYLCTECEVDHDKSGLLCDEHNAEHPHQDNYGPPLELANSPRMGMCGYDGSAEPPYV